MVYRYFFEIPVYRCKPEKYEAELQAEKRRYVALFRYPPGMSVSAEEVAGWFTESRWYAWHYNEAIGWIRLYAFGNDQIRAEYYFVKAKHIVRRPARRVFKWQGKAFEMCVFPREGNPVIFRRVLKALENLHREQPFRGRRKRG